MAGHIEQGPTLCKYYMVQKRIGHGPSRCSLYKLDEEAIGDHLAHILPVWAGMDSMIRVGGAGQGETKAASFTQWQ